MGAIDKYKSVVHAMYLVVNKTVTVILSYCSVCTPDQPAIMRKPKYFQEEGGFALFLYDETLQNCMVCIL